MEKEQESKITKFYKWGEGLNNRKINSKRILKEISKK